MPRIFIATGGTGGHIYPGIVTAHELKRRGFEVIFIGALGSSLERIEEAGFLGINIQAKGFVSKGLSGKILSLFSMMSALGESLAAFRRFKPQLVLGFGGYSSLPPIVAAFLYRVPSMLHEQNAMPGAANKILAFFVRRICVGFHEAMHFFPKRKTVWVGNPLREFDVSLSREKAIDMLGLDPLARTVFVFGGSQGSRVFNQEVVEVFRDIPEGLKLQVIHITGRYDFLKVRSLYAAYGVRAVVREYMEQISLAYAASDVVIARAGAGSVTELGLWGIPAILIPYPGAKGHQKYNARILERLGMAVIIEEKCLRQDILRDKIFSQLTCGGSFKPRILSRQELKSSFVPDGAHRLADEVVKVLHE